MPANTAQGPFRRQAKTLIIQESNTRSRPSEASRSCQCDARNAPCAHLTPARLLSASQRQAPRPIRWFTPPQDMLRGATHKQQMHRAPAFIPGRRRKARATMKVTPRGRGRRSGEEARRPAPRRYDGTRLHGSCRQRRSFPAASLHAEQACQPDGGSYSQRRRREEARMRAFTFLHQVLLLP